jgi:hypothetical protein
MDYKNLECRAYLNFFTFAIQKIFDINLKILIFLCFFLSFQTVQAFSPENKQLKEFESIVMDFDKDPMSRKIQEQTIISLEAFLKKYPGSVFTENAREMSKSIKELISQTKIQNTRVAHGKDIQEIMMSNDPKILQNYLDKNPSSPYASGVRQQLKLKLEQQDYNKAVLEGSVESLNAFLVKYPNGFYTTNALETLRAIKAASNKIQMPRAEPSTSLAAAVVMPNNNAAKQDTKYDFSKLIAGRQALVIGNNAYKHVSPLINAKNDALAVAQLLKKVGYKVTLAIDQDEKSFKQVLRNFKISIKPGDEILFFYAGHGVQIAGTNYLLPTDIKGDSEDRVKDEAIPLQRVLDDMEERKTRLTLAILDACRDNPFKSAGRAIGGRGLAVTSPATGQMILFSAGTGQKALDKLGPSDKDPNGLFTRVLIKEMQQAGIPVDQVFKNVREKVVQQAKQVGHDQVPALYDQVIGNFFISK